MISLSSNHFSHDIQAKDAIDYLRDNNHDGEHGIYGEFIDTFPEWYDLVWEGAWVDTEQSGVDPDYTSWVTDWIEHHTDIMWWEGEPVIMEPGDFEEGGE